MNEFKKQTLPPEFAGTEFTEATDTERSETIKYFQNCARMILHNTSTHEDLGVKLFNALARLEKPIKKAAAADAVDQTESLEASLAMIVATSIAHLLMHSPLIGTEALQDQLDNSLRVILEQSTAWGKPRNG